MGVLENLVAALRVREGKVPDYVPNHFVSIRPTFNEKNEDSLNIEEDDVVLSPPYDLTIPHALGAQSIKCGPGNEFHEKLTIPEEYFQDHKKEPDAEYTISEIGIIHKKAWNPEEGYHWWYVEGYLTTPERLDQWMPHIKKVQPPNNETLKAFNKFLPIAYKKNIAPFVPGGGPFTEVIESMGLKAYAKAMRTNRVFVKCLLDAFTDNICRFFKTLVEKTDTKLFMIADDVAMKNNVMLAPEIFEDFYMPSYKRIVQAVGDRYIYFHSDGFIEPLIPLMIEAGFHGVQCLEEAAAVDIRRVKKKYGDKICLIGNMDVSRDLYFSSPKEIEIKSKKLVESLGPAGYIFGPCSTIYAGHPLENIRAMVQGWKAGNQNFNA